MKTLSSPVSTNAAAAQSGWTELYDLYLRESISTPWGTTNILRLTPHPASISFFTPTQAPEPDATQGDAATYSTWPIARDQSAGETKFSGRKLQLTASNVTADWAEMLQAVDWRGTRLMIRKAPLNVSGLTNADCAVLWSGVVESFSASEREIVFSCGSRLADLGLIAPRQNLHKNCRFTWADDYCTAIRFAAANYKSKTCGASCTTTRVNSAGLTEDAGSEGSYGTDLVEARYGLGSFSESNYLGAVTNQPVTADASTDELRIIFSSQTDVYTLGDDVPVTFAATGFPGGLAAATTYYIRDWRVDSRFGYWLYHYFKVAATPGGAAINLTSAGSGVTFSTAGAFNGEQVCTSGALYWKLNPSELSNQWGTPVGGYRLIADAQAGLYDPDLTPYWRVDFATAKTPKVWRIKLPDDIALHKRLRLLSLFGSADEVTHEHVSFFEMPPVAGQFVDFLVPDSPSYRYWRICCRSYWGTTPPTDLLGKVQAYENGRNYWAWGRITFATNTTTVALRGISRRVYASYSGVLHVAALPVAPANGDTFVVERGCRRTFNACAEKGNWENFGGFGDLPAQAIIK